MVSGESQPKLSLCSFGWAMAAPQKPGALAGRTSSPALTRFISMRDVKAVLDAYGGRERRRLRAAMKALGWRERRAIAWGRRTHGFVANQGRCFIRRHRVEDRGGENV
jgi:hypothetical protein